MWRPQHGNIGEPQESRRAYHSKKTASNIKNEQTSSSWVRRDHIGDEKWFKLYNCLVLPVLLTTVQHGNLPRKMKKW